MKEAGVSVNRVYLSHELLADDVVVEVRRRNLRLYQGRVRTY